MVLTLVADVDEERHRVTAAGESGARHHVERDPQPPGVAVAQRAHGAEPCEETPENEDRAEREDTRQHPEPTREDRTANRLRSMGRHLRSPCSLCSLFLRLRNITAPSTPYSAIGAMKPR